MQVDTQGSDLDTVLYVYTGTSLATLTVVTFNDNCGTDPTYFQSCLTFVAPVSATATDYYIQLTGSGGSTGNIVLHLVGTPAPPNDNFASPGTTFPAVGTTAGASLETGEPSAGTGATVTVWYQLTVPSGPTTSVYSVRERWAISPHGKLELVEL